jgi:hypothetical protein
VVPVILFINYGSLFLACCRLHGLSDRLDALGCPTSVISQIIFDPNKSRLRGYRSQKYFTEILEPD